MATLIDLAPATKTVHGHAVFGVSIRGVIELLRRFPELQKLMNGLTPEADDLIAAAPDAVAAIIAAGLGHPGNAELEAQADRLPVEVQIDFLEAIAKLTMPNGVGPFVAKFESLMGASGAPSSPAEGSTTNSRRPRKR